MIYLDNAATTACAPEVIEAMVPFFRDKFANASSIDHVPGSQSRKAVDQARESVARMIGAKPEDVIFTSGATEANNLVVFTRLPVISTSIEHPSVLDPVKKRSRNDDELVRVTSDGLVDEEHLVTLLRGSLESRLMTIIATNNEVGTEQSLDRLCEIAKSHRCVSHFDATQAVGTQEINVRRSGIDGLSISAHKFYGPKGIGALIASPQLRNHLVPLQLGGGHERGFRSGTLNVPAIVGFGVACELLIKYRVDRRTKFENLRKAFLAKLRQSLGDKVIETVSASTVSPNILSLRIKDTNGRALLSAVREDVAFSLGSACATNKSEPSHVLSALGFDRRTASQIFRLSFSHEDSVTEIQQAAGLIANASRSLSEFSVQQI